MTHSAQFANRYGLQIGDGVIIAKSTIGWVQHFGIYVGLDRFGRALVAENHQGHGVRIVPLNEFLNGGEPTRIERFNGDYWSQQQVVRRATALVGRKYNVLTYNCEHFANEVRYGQVKSRQVHIAVGAMLALLFIIFLLPKHSKHSQ